MYQIKQLEWVECELNKNLFRAAGFYVFSFEIWKRPNEGKWQLLMGNGLQYYDTLNDAKSAAQSHYEKEVMRHLTTHKRRE